MIQVQDQRYEEELSRNPYNIRTWLNYIDHKKGSKAAERRRVYDRALLHLPRSYKIWHMYLQERTHKLRHRCITDAKYDDLVRLYERALVHMHKMPVIWYEYCSLLVKMRRGTATRKAFDRALQALPITQHHTLWELYIEWATEFGVPEAAIKVYHRYLMICPSAREEFVDFLEANEQFDEAARQLSICIDDEHFVSAKRRTKHSMWLHLCDLCAMHPQQVSRVLNVDAVIRSGIARFSDEVGRLWCRLADYYIRSGLFEKARDTYEEGINAVITVRDFTLVFEAYAKFEESVLSTKIRITADIEEVLGEEATGNIEKVIEGGAGGVRSSASANAGQEEISSILAGVIAEKKRAYLQQQQQGGGSSISSAGAAKGGKKPAPAPAATPKGKAKGKGAAAAAKGKGKGKGKAGGKQVEQLEDEGDEAAEQGQEQDPEQEVKEEEVSLAALDLPEMADLERYVEDKRDIMLRLVRLEYLMDMRPLLLNAVVLRQNPHNVYEWHKRIKLYKADYFNADKDDNSSGIDKPTALQRIITTYMEAINTVDPKQAKGKFSTIWLSLADFYEHHYSNVRHLNVENARAIFRKATGVNFKSVDELAQLWTSWAEMELKYEEYDKALEVMKLAITEPAASVQRRKAKAALMGTQKSTGKAGQGYQYATDADAGSLPNTDKVHKNIKVWELYLDLEEAMGTLETTRAAYDRVMEISIVTPQMVLNYASLLEEHAYFEDSFRVYERSIAIFGFPHVKKLWCTYLDKFIARYEGRKLERLRDLFEQVIRSAPAEDRIEFYLKFSKVEEKYGLARHALAVLDRATKDGDIADDLLKRDLYRLYIRKAEHFYGITKTRPIYERAIQNLSDTSACGMCIEYAAIEVKLGEIDRARAIYRHGSQFVDPKHDAEHHFWDVWQDFEVECGNEDTFRDMLRMKRSAEVAFAQVNYMASEMAAAVAAEEKAKKNPAAGGGDAMSRLAAASAEAGGEAPRGPAGFVAASTSAPAAAADPESAATDSSPAPSRKRNQEEIDIDMEDLEEDEEEEDGAVKLQQKEVPAAVFGSLASAAGGNANGASAPPTKAARLK